MFKNRVAAALLASLLGLGLTTGCATPSKSASTKAKAAKVASKNKSRYLKGKGDDYSLTTGGGIDEKFLKRGQKNMSASAFDSF